MYWLQYWKGAKSKSWTYCNIWERDTKWWYKELIDQSMQSIDKRLAKKLIRYLAFWLLAFAKVSNICYKNAKLILYLIRDLSKIQYFWRAIVFMDEPKSLLYNNVFFIFYQQEIMIEKNWKESTKDNIFYSIFFRTLKCNWMVNRNRVLNILFNRERKWKKLYAFV